MLCPNCKTENLMTTERQNIQIDHCPRCRGVWLDRGELEKLLRLSSPDERQSDRYNGREFGDEEDTSRGKYRDNDQDEGEDEDRGTERREPSRSRDRYDNEGSDSYQNRDRDAPRGTGRGEPEGRSIWREIFEQLGDRIPRP